MSVPSDYADKVLQEALTAATGGLDPEAAERALTSAVRAVAKQMEALEQKDYADLTPEQIARAAAHTSKSADVIFRLMEFAKGNPDSRPDKAGDWLRGLTNDQFAIVQGFIEANERRERERSAQEGGA